MGVVAHTLKVELETLECIQCGIPHAIPAQLYKAAAAVRKYAEMVRKAA